ncbi:MAG: MerR family transcriptional regulator [Muribaculaceae bacterium]|nr:MerR family transcriptional regulator [Muribaculaceae bacterium]MDE6552422.1 MerR family transcriptional regulator [Muribaculaceae bacterium]MDE7350378.1 MerR family transcriptional regulator [Muribaculaceae bacterium]
MDDLSKKYYKIGDVADFLGVPQATIRYWELEFPEISPSRSRKGLRQYTPSDIETLRIIHYLVKIKGLKVEAAKAQMKINRDNISKKLKVFSELQDIRSELEVMLKALSKRR